MSRRMTVSYESRPIYDIVFEHSFAALAQEIENISQGRKRKICIVTDTKVKPLYLEEVKSALEQAGFPVIFFAFPAGEENKNLYIVQHLYTALIQAHFDRKDLLVALGGGVVGDLTGYAAATYLRGIDFVQIPTTLLSQVDSSVGGKTGVDFDSYKNMVGAFHMPKLVYMNLSVLKTLSPRIFRSGLGEVTKYAFITDAPFFDWLQAHKDQVLAMEPEAMEYVVYQSCENKRIVVEEDPKEHGRRALLNFGHTLGHAIEKQMDFTLYHGECVAIGMAAAAKMSADKGYISKELADSVIELIRGFQLPVHMEEIEQLEEDVPYGKERTRSAAEKLSREEVIKATMNDKKMDAGTIRFILLKDMGNAVIDTTVSKEDMAAGLETVGV